MSPSILSTACLALLLVATTGCRSSPRWPPRPSDLRAADSLALERTACFGTCPVYRVVVARSGRVRVEPGINRNWPNDSTAVPAPVKTDSIPPRAFQELLSGADMIGFHALPADIAANPSMCGPIVTDNPAAIVTIWLPSRVMRVRDYHGCPWGPAGLRRFEDYIDEVTGAERYVRSGR